MEYSEEWLLDQATTHYLDICKKIYPRRYKLTDEFYSPKNVQIAAVNTYLFAKQGFDARLEKQFGIFNRNPVSISGGTTYQTCVRLMEFSTPTYFVSSALLTALMNTDLPKMRLCDLKWPMEAMLFVLPRETLKTPTGWCTMSAVARSHKGQISPTMRDEEPVMPGSNALTSFSLGTSLDGVIYSWCHPLNEDPIDVGASDPHECDIQDAAEAEFISTHTKIIVQLLLALSMRKDLVTSGEMIKAARAATKHKKAKSPLWSPNVMGRNYRAKTESEGRGTHQSPEMHWRKGHWRMYEKGEHWKVDKTIWIEPILVNP